MKCECGACKTCVHRQYMRAQREVRIKAVKPVVLDDLDRKAMAMVLQPSELSGPLRSTLRLMEDLA